MSSFVRRLSDAWDVLRGWSVVYEYLFEPEHVTVHYYPDPDTDYCEELRCGMATLDQKDGVHKLHLTFLKTEDF